jgi:transcriptional regulator of NAD metabolism
MQAEQRRQSVLDILNQSTQPVSAGTLASRFSVSRQIIVGDIALLRAAGAEISATPRGYIIQHSPEGFVRQVACRHNTLEMEAELNAIVDQGCTVLDVIVEHPVYGQITGPLQLSNRYDVSQFLTRCIQPLSNLTEGIHLHTLSCPDEAAYTRVLTALEEMGFLLKD